MLSLQQLLYDAVQNNWPKGMDIMNTYFRFIDILKSYHILKKFIIVEI